MPAPLSRPACLRPICTALAVAAAATLAGCIGLPALPGTQSVTATCIDCGSGVIVTIAPAPAPDDDAAGLDAALGAAPGAGSETAGDAPETSGSELAGIAAPEPLAGTIRAAEGLRLEPYRDAGGTPHIGYGHRITEAEAGALLARDMADARAAARRAAGIDTWRALDPVRRDVLTEAAYVLGEAGLAGFRRMLAALAAGDHALAADELTDSLWARQAPGRVADLARRLRAGTTGEAAPPAAAVPETRPAEERR